MKAWIKRAAITGLIWFCGRTSRMERINWHILESLERANKPYLVGFWHNNILYAIFDLGRYRYPVIISRSRDGDHINWVAERFGFRGLRGSPAAGAASAVREAIRQLAGGRGVIVTPDGPKGPCYEVKPGIVALARKKQVPIVPVCWSTPTRWEFSSWDRTRLPKPFSRVCAIVGTPLTVGSEEDEEAARRRLEVTLRNLTRTAEAYSGAEALFPDPVLRGFEDGDTSLSSGG